MEFRGVGIVFSFDSKSAFFDRILKNININPLFIAFKRDSEIFYILCHEYGHYLGFGESESNVYAYHETSKKYNKIEAETLYNKYSKNYDFD